MDKLFSSENNLLLIEYVASYTLKEIEDRKFTFLWDHDVVTVDYDQKLNKLHILTDHSEKDVLGIHEWLMKETIWEQKELDD